MASAPRARAARVESDHDSDSDNESVEESVSTVQLGLADEPLEGDDEQRPLVSRLGGAPAWLPTKAIPPPSIALCKHCNTTMEVLVQIFCPLDDSPYDRSLIVWGCARPACQRKGQGSIRVVRHLQRNAKWAAKLQRQQERREAKAARLQALQKEADKRRAEEEARSKVNPFASGSSASGAGAGGLFGGGTFGTSSNPFAPSTAPPEASAASAEPMDVSTPAATNGAEDDDEEESSSEGEDDEEAMMTAIQSASSSWTAWPSKLPAYRPPLYLNTIEEPSSSRLPAACTPKVQQVKETAPNASSDELASTEAESFERQMVDSVDDVLEKFISRVGRQGGQVVRHEFGGQPLPFSAQGETYKRLWPRRKNTNPASRVQVLNASSMSGYDRTSIPPCEACGGPRTFELQLMPNLVSALRKLKFSDPDNISPVSPQGANTNTNGNQDAHTLRRLQLESELGHALPSTPSADGVIRSSGAQATTEAMSKKTGLSWATALIFVCEKDCAIPRDDDAHGIPGEAGECWREERVEVMFEE